MGHGYTVLYRKQQEYLVDSGTLSHLGAEQVPARDAHAAESTGDHGAHGALPARRLASDYDLQGRALVALEDGGRAAISFGAGFQDWVSL